MQGDEIKSGHTDDLATLLAKMKAIVGDRWDIFVSNDGGIRISFESKTEIEGNYESLQSDPTVTKRHLSLIFDLVPFVAPAFWKQEYDKRKATVDQMAQVVKKQLKSETGFAPSPEYYPISKSDWELYLNYLKAKLLFKQMPTFYWDHDIAFVAGLGVNNFVPLKSDDSNYLLLKQDLDKVMSLLHRYKRD